MSVDQNSSNAADIKASKRRRRVKKPIATNPEDLERKKTLASIVHKKVAISSNWQRFTANNLHQQKEEKTVEQSRVSSIYTGMFRKNRKAQKAFTISSKSDPKSASNDNPSHVSNANLTSESAGPKKDVKLTRCIGIDCEMVGVDDGKDSMLARVSLVNSHGDCIYDKHVKPKEEITDYRTHVSGVRPSDLVDAESFETVQKEVAEIIKGRILVGHALKNDLKVLYLSHPRRYIRDTSKYDGFRKLNKNRTPGLKKLAAAVLGVTIQEGEHNSVIDARATMQLYMMYSKEWEADLKKKFRHKHRAIKK